MIERKDSVPAVSQPVQKETEVRRFDGKGDAELTLEFDDLALFGYFDQLGTEFDAELWDMGQLGDEECAILCNARWGPDWS